MNLQSLRCFVTVADELHFGRAAKRLNMSQPPLTQRIKTFEEEIGAVLFHRNKRTVRLSETGAALLDQARQIVNQADGLPHLAQRVADGKSGFLQAGFLTSGVFSETRELYRKVSTGIPGVTVIWKEMNSSDQMEALVAQTLDIGFAHLPSTRRELEFRRVNVDKLMIALPETHPLADESRVSLSQFKHDDYIFPLRHIAPGYYDRMISALHAAGITPTIPQQPRTIFAIASMVSMGAGISLLPSSVAAAGFPGVRLIPISDDDILVETAILWNPRNRSPTLERVLAALGVGSSS